MAGSLRIMSIFGSTFGPFGGLRNTAESFGFLSKQGKGKHGFLKERERHWESVSASLPNSVTQRTIENYTKISVNADPTCHNLATVMAFTVVCLDIVQSLSNLA